MNQDRNIISDEYDVHAIVEAQREFFATGRTRSISFRRESLLLLEKEIEKRTSSLLEALRSDLGKPPVEAYLAEIYFVLSEIRLFRKKLSRWAAPKRVGNPFYFFPARSEVRFEPFGSTVVIAPWNYPMQLSLGPVIASIAAGNTVLLKPSEHAPATAELLAEMIGSVFDPGHATVVNGAAEIGKAILAESFDAWFYTGSEKIGRYYAEAAAKDLAPCTLELGGKCPCIVTENVDLDTTVDRIVATKFFNAGQTCIAPDFVLIPQSLRQSFLKKATKALRENFGKGQSSDLARIVNRSHYDRLAAMIPEDAIRNGEDDPDNLYLAPRIIGDADWDSPAMQEEIFGPILPVVTYESFEEMLRKLGTMPSPLALYAFTKSGVEQEIIASSIRSGSVCFNDAIKQATNLNLPFGGVGASGMGRYRGRAGFQTFTYERAVLKRFFVKDLFQIRPPYRGSQSLESLRRFMK